MKMLQDQKRNTALKAWIVSNKNDSLSDKII